MNSRLRRPAGALLAGALVSSVFAFAPAHAADPVGTITGMVTGDGAGALEDVYVFARQYNAEDDYWSGIWVDYTLTDVDGNYSLDLPPGEYRIGFSDSNDGADFVEEYYDDAVTIEDGDTQTVIDGGTLAGRDAELAVASHVTGTVTGPGAAALPDISVAAYQEVFVEDESRWDSVAYAYTDELGQYDLGGLRAGTYRIGFQDDAENPTYAAEFHLNQASVRTAQDVTVTTVAPATVDAELALGSEISGTVTDVADAPLAEASVYAYVQAGGEWDYAGRAITGAGGNYAVGGLAAGTYRLEFEYESGQDYLYEYWNNKGSFDEADSIVVGTDGTISGKDAKLVEGEHDPLPFLEGVTIPQISGAPQVGQTLTVTAGTWNAPSVTADYQWYNDNGAIAGATATTYVPTASDVGTTLVVLVDASAPGYQDRTNMSNVVGPIVAAAATTPPPVVAPAPVPAPAPAPVISFSKKIDVAGALTVGSTLKLKNFKALVSRAVVTYKIQWYAGSKKIKKATKSKLKVTQALKGKKIKVKVSATSGTTTKTVTVKVGKIR